MPTLLTIALILSLASAAPADPLGVTVTLGPKPHHVGQGIEVFIEVGATEGDAPLVVEPPRVSGAEIFEVPGASDFNRTRRFMVVPTRPGIIDIPPFRARSGARSGASKPWKLSVSTVPAEGRTAAFLGGVGKQDVSIEANLSTVRAGQTLEVRVSVIGDAAWGSVRPPDLAGWASPTLSVGPAETRLEPGQPPFRSFRYRLRPLKAGRVALPPVAIAAFDPASRRYLTRTTRSLVIEVDAPPRFDPTSIVEAAPPKGRRSGVAWVALIAASLVVALGMTAWLVARRRRRRKPDPRIIARELAKSLGEAEPAKGVVAALTVFLQRAGGRPAGVLTPPEAREAFERLTGDPAIGAQAEALVGRCDRTNYGPGDDDTSGLIAGARELLGRIAARGGPGEAVETTMDS
jgi:hypothetical protein